VKTINSLICLFIFTTLVSCSSHVRSIGPTQPALVRDKSLNESLESGRATLYISQYGKGKGCTLYVNQVEIAKVNYYTILKVDVPAGRHKILCYFKGKATSSWFNKHYSGYANIEMTAKAGKKHSVFYRWKYNKSLKMNRPYLIVYDKPSIVNPYVQKRSLMVQKVNRIDSNHLSIKEGDAWRNAQNMNSAAIYKSFIVNYPYSVNKTTAQSSIEKIEKEEKQKYTKAISTKSFNPVYKFIEGHPNSNYKIDAVKSAIKFNKRTKGAKKRNSNYEKIAGLDQSYVDMFPKKIRYDMKLKTVGPPNFNVGKIISLKNTGLSSSIIAAKVSATNQRYKNFEIEEIQYLKAKGLSDSIIEAMIKTTANYDLQIKQIQQNEEMMASIRKLIEESQKSNSRQSIRRPARSSNSGGQSQVGSCLKRKVAMEACRKIGGFMRSACEITAKSSYPCTMR